MSRYIEVDAVIARIAGQMSYEIEVETGNEIYCVDLAEELLNDIPSIDIVRCKECVEYDDDWCMYWQNVVDAYDFCSYGERREP